MPVYNIEHSITCPFYVGMSKTTITCEGAFKGNYETVHHFQNQFDCAEHISKFCCVNNGKKCKHCQLVSILYEKEIKK